MALGAGFHLVEKDKDSGKSKGKDANPGGKDEESANSRRQGSDDSDKDAPAVPFGWTSVVENWLCFGGPTASQPTVTSPSTTSSAGNPPTPAIDAAESEPNAVKEQKKSKGRK